MQALCLPREMPCTILRIPLDSWGFSVSHLCSCMRVQQTRGFLWATDSCSILVHQNVQAMWPSAAWGWLDRQPPLQACLEVLAHSAPNMPHAQEEVVR